MFFGIEVSHRASLDQGAWFFRMGQLCVYLTFSYYMEIILFLQTPRKSPSLTNLYALPTSLYYLIIKNNVYSRGLLYHISFLKFWLTFSKSLGTQFMLMTEYFTIGGLATNRWVFSADIEKAVYKYERFLHNIEGECNLLFWDLSLSVVLLGKGIERAVLFWYLSFLLVLFLLEGWFLSLCSFSILIICICFFSWKITVIFLWCPFTFFDRPVLWETWSWSSYFHHTNGSSWAPGTILTKLLQHLLLFDLYKCYPMF